MRKEILSFLLLSFLCMTITGCQSSAGNEGQVQGYSFAALEPEWIRNGEPILYEGEEWFPVAGVENFLDSEVLFIGEYRGVPFFVDKIDIRPYSRLYTKFSKNKFRYFKKKTD